MKIANDRMDKGLFDSDDTLADFLSRGIVANGNFQSRSVGKRSAQGDRLADPQGCVGCEAVVADDGQKHAVSGPHDPGAFRMETAEFEWIRPSHGLFLKAQALRIRETEEV
jgi:hypothetical protein